MFNRYFPWVTFVTRLLCAGCPGPNPPPTGCVPTRSEWDSRFQTLVNTHCGNCHGARPQFGAPMALASYEDLRRTTAVDPNHLRMLNALQLGTMPPATLPRMPDADRRALVSWLSCGTQTASAQSGYQATRSAFTAPTAPPANLDHIDLLARDYPVSASESDHYQCFVFDGNVTRDRFVRRFELVADETRVLHHVVLLRDTNHAAPSSDYSCIGNMPEGSEYLYAWAPGQSAVEFPEGSGLRIRANERYVLQIHYNNTAHLANVQDSSGVRLYVTDSASTEYGMVAIGPVSFTLPARRTTVVTSQCRVTQDMTMLAGMPHMHELGAAFESSKVTDAATDSIIGLTGWSFDAQLFYRYDNAFRAGDVIRTSCTFNNTRDEDVRTGPRTQDEMCFNFAYVTPPPTSRYCDNGNGAPSDVAYTPGSCAPSGAASELPLVRVNWMEGEPPALGGGTIVNGNYVLQSGRAYIDRATTAVGRLDLERSFTLIRGQVWFEGSNITADFASHTFVQSVEGPSFGQATPTSYRATLAALESPTTQMLTCPSAQAGVSRPLRFAVNADGTLTLGVQPATSVGGSVIWLYYNFMRL